MADVIGKAIPRRGARFVCMEGGDQLVSLNPNLYRLEPSMIYDEAEKW